MKKGDSFFGNVRGKAMKSALHKIKSEAIQKMGDKLKGGGKSIQATVVAESPEELQKGMEMGAKMVPKLAKSNLGEVAEEDSAITTGINESHDEDSDGMFELPEDEDSLNLLIEAAQQKLKNNKK